MMYQRVHECYFMSFKISSQARHCGKYLLVNARKCLNKWKIHSNVRNMRKGNVRKCRGKRFEVTQFFQLLSVSTSEVDMQLGLMF